MTHKQFYNNNVKPYLKKKDKPFNRELYDTQKDFLYKEGLITGKQVRNWDYPDNKYFV